MGGIVEPRTTTSQEININELGEQRTQAQSQQTRKPTAEDIAKHAFDLPPITIEIVF